MADTVFPLPKFHFKVDIDGTEISFQEVTGLDQEVQFLEYRHGDAEIFVTQKRLGITKTSTLSFKRGTFKSKSELADIYKKVYDEKTKYYSQADKTLPITIQLLDEDGGTIVTWKVENAIPIKFVGTDLKSDANEVAIEQIDFVHEGLKTEF